MLLKYLFNFERLNLSKAYGGIAQLGEHLPCTQGVSPRTPSIDRLQRGLPGYLILFAPHAFAPQRQLLSSWPPSPLVFKLRVGAHSLRSEDLRMRELTWETPCIIK